MRLRLALPSVGLLLAALLTPQAAHAAPIEAPVVTSADYPSDGQQLRGVGRPGSFTFTRAAGDTDVVAFEYAVNDLSVRRRVEAPSGTATVLIAPPRDFTNEVYVWPIGAAGDVGPSTTYSFDVSWQLDGPVSSWPLDGTAGDLTATKVTFAEGRSGDAATFNGTTSRLSAGGPVVDAGRAFTVAAWAKVTNNTHVNTVVSQAGGFQLSYDNATRKWSFGGAVSDAPARRNVWEHLVGVYDPDAGQLRLYVNGREQAAKPAATPGSATGVFEIGRTFAGRIDDVRVWDRIVYPGELPDLVNGPVLQRAHWSFDEGAGTTAAPGATLRGGAAWIADGHEGGALSGGYAATSGPVVRTDESFSAVVWVRRSAFGTTNTALSQNGTRRSGFTLGFRDGKWSFDVPTSDTDGASVVSANIDPVLWPTDPAAWTLLAGVYDHPRRTISLYLDGQKMAEVSGVTAWNAGGATLIGRAKPAGPWRGDLDDARLYTGALTDRDVQNLYFGW
ncbi:LamG domain-containing protein [Herbidospora sp. RD11066]